MSHIWIQPTGGALGADVHGVDLSQPVDEPTFKRIAAAWAEHLVLRFSGQKIEGVPPITDQLRLAAERMFPAIA